jgi:alkanesulfonate monooxygenase SsuD/methylene tetrahydromethanopterin reductase-like flavin-dependent oxidoreductase (luciferase family)
MLELATEVRWQDKRFQLPMERILLTEKLGYDAVFTAEGYGSEAMVPLGFIAAHTRKLKLGTKILQVSGRPPVIAATSFQTLDHLSGGGRVIAGLGSATPMQREGFEGRAWGNPVTRMRDYVTILRQAFAGKALDHPGQEWAAPYRGPDNKGLAPQTLGLDVISAIPIVIASAHPQMTALAGEIGDGWTPPSWGIGAAPTFHAMLEKGFARAGGGKSLENFKIWVHVDVLVDKDVRAAMRPFKEYTVHYAHLMRELMQARGYGELASYLEGVLGEMPETKLQAGEKTMDVKAWEHAVNSVPDDYIDGGWLVGPVDRIAERVKLWFDSGIHGLVIRYGVPFTHERIVENLDIYPAIAKAAGRGLRGA